MFSPQESAFMFRALSLAERGRGRVEPNPMVGCVLVGHDGQVLAEGYHHRFGGRHAETEALHAAQKRQRCTNGATAFVTLEPCCHYGKQPPCTEALIRAGIKRVVVPLADPFPRVAGGGIKALQQAGVQVDVGCEEAAARHLMAPWLKRVVHGRPWVIAKWAQSLDGRLSTPWGDSQWISGEAARKEAHRLRGLCDAVIVGAETLRQDNPLLLPRLVRPRRIPTRVVVSASLDLPLRAKLFHTVADGPVEVWTTQAAFDRRREVCRRLEKLGVRVLAVGKGQTLRGRDLQQLLSGVSVPHLSPRARGREWNNVLLEGGGSLQGAFFDTFLIDEIAIFMSDILIGGHSPTLGRGLALASAGHRRLADCPRVEKLSARKIGTDWMFTGRIRVP